MNQIVLWRWWYAAGAACVPVAGGVERASDHLGGGLDDHTAGRDFALEEVKERGELGRADRVGAAVTTGALVADPVEHELHPIVGLGVGLRIPHVRLKRGEFGRRLRVGRGAGRVGVGRGDGLPERACFRYASLAPTTVVPAVVDERITAAVERTERLTEKFRNKSTENKG